MYYFDYKLINLLNLDNNKKYSCEFILGKVKRRASLYSKKNIMLWNVDKKFLNLLMDFKLVGTNKSFYELFYLNNSEWRTHYKTGFTKIMIIKMIKSIIIDKQNNTNNFIYRDTGKKIDKIII